MKHFDYDVIVIGGGHAGTEAAYAAARCGARTALVTLRQDDIGVMSCNPAIGGLGKGHLVREIDAFGGLMGLAADQSGIQFRLLNRRKGAAVQGPRVQSDRKLYKLAAQNLLHSQKHVRIIEAEVKDLYLKGGHIAGIVLSDDSIIKAQSVVLCTGTFLNGVIHIGTNRKSGGRLGDRVPTTLADRLKNLGLKFGRLKTGTPPRLSKASIDWSVLEMQPGDTDPTMFSFLSDAPTVGQISCGITHTNPQTHEIIRKNLLSSAMYGGHIEGNGPRYCPSIEDKIVRFADKQNHQIFVEPEGLDSDLVYPNGISTSLPADVQHSYVRSIKGFENAEIVQPGYAIEYDYIDPQILDRTLHLLALPGLFLAGQINGTTGYEEAAAQGLVAGLNAAHRALSRDPIVFGRDKAYIGVMIDDLVTKGVSEPYRMFTSRAEYRLHLRADNADQRLTPWAEKLGILSDRRIRVFHEKRKDLRKGKQILSGVHFSPQQAQAYKLPVNQDGKRRTGLDLLTFPDISIKDLTPLFPDLASVPLPIQRQLKIEATYQTYIDREAHRIAALQRDENKKIPIDFNYLALSSLSTELKEKLTHVKPETLGQASRVEGMTPAALALILTKILSHTKESRQSA